MPHHGAGVVTEAAKQLTAIHKKIAKATAPANPVSAEKALMVDSALRSRLPAPPGADEGAPLVRAACIRSSRWRLAASPLFMQPIHSTPTLTHWPLGSRLQRQTPREAGTGSITWSDAAALQTGRTIHGGQLRRRDGVNNSTENTFRHTGGHADEFETSVSPVGAQIRSRP